MSGTKPKVGVKIRLIRRFRELIEPFLPITDELINNDDTII